MPAVVKDWKAINKSRPEDRKKVDQKTRKFVPLTDAVIEDHLLGKETIGVYALALFSRGLALQQSDWKGAIASYAEAERVYADLARESPSHRRNVDVMERYITSICIDHRQGSDTLDHAQRALAISEAKWRAAPEDVQSQFDYAIDVSQMGAAVSELAGPREALPYRKKSLEIRKQIAARDPENVQARQQLAMAEFNYGFDLQACGELMQGRSMLAKAAELFSLLRSKGQLLPASEPFFARTLEISGDVEHALGHSGAACRFYERAEELFSVAAGRKSLNQPMMASLADTRDRLKSCPGSKYRSHLPH